MPRALEGVRVLDLSRALAGPFGSQILGDLGAEVIKIERPGLGDDTRSMPPHIPAPGLSAYFLALNRNKKSLALDLKSDRGRAIFTELVKLSDIVYDNFRPGVLERLGLDYDSLKEINPRIICCSVSGFGQTGPYRDRPAYDLVVQGFGGIMSYTGDENGRPVRQGAPMGDMGGGIFAAMACVTALYQREQTGRGQRADISMLDVQIFLQGYRSQYYWLGGDIPRPIGNGHVSATPIGSFPTRSFEIVIDANDDGTWRRLATAMGLSQLCDDPRFNSRATRLQNRPELFRILTESFASRTGEEWMDALVAAGVPAAPINTIDRALSDPQVLAREMVVQIQHPQIGPLNLVGTPLKLSDSPPVYQPQPQLNEHLEEILGGLLGMDQEEIASLRREGVV